MVGTASESGEREGVTVQTSTVVQLAVCHRVESFLLAAAVGGGGWRAGGGVPLAPRG